MRSAWLWKSASDGLRAHLPSGVLLLSLYAAALMLLDDADERVTLEFGLLAGELIRLVPAFLAAAVGLAVALALRQPQAARQCGPALRRLTAVAWPEILLLRLPVACALLLATSYLYFTFKVNIAKFAPFVWDGLLLRIDRALFFGHDPWTLTHGLFPGAWATRIFDALYLAWFLLLLAAILGVAALPMRHPLRLSFLLALGLNWIIGGVILSILLPAAGPVYLERMTGDTTFAPLMQALRAQAQGTRIMALEIQDWLWDGYARADVAPAGIAAFPSLHVSIPTTLACLGFAAGRMFGWLMAGFTAAVLVGSVHLGWHYAIDGLAGIVLGILLWRFSTRLIAGWLAYTESRPGAEPAAEIRGGLVFAALRRISGRNRE